MCKKDHRNFWKEVKHHTNIKVTLPTKNEGVHDDVNIRSMWKYQYENIFSSVKDSRCNKVNFNCIIYNTGMTIDAGEQMNIINEISGNKSPGRNGLNAEHIEFADSQLLVLLSIIVSYILVPGCIPKLLT